ncbi:hypothetical protein E2C01_057301 [Portunus trituberculatus]|uniref:Uncharacterized protein n=1 Tax=Portunus trituberculatus TaxID=210409 RepID=A0A5B7H1H6_PORTR|nr:hypothetical protein [Portunus trituberculatus]
MPRRAERGVGRGVVHPKAYAKAYRAQSQEVISAARNANTWRKVLVLSATLPPARKNQCGNSESYKNDGWERVREPRSCEKHPVKRSHRPSSRPFPTSGSSARWKKWQRAVSHVN